MRGNLYLGAMSLLGLSAHQAVAVTIKAFTNQNCVESGNNRATARCENIAEGACCKFQVNVVDPRAVWMGGFQNIGNPGPLGAIGTWHDPGVHTECGVAKDTATGYNTICMQRTTAQNPWDRPPVPAKAQGGSWQSVMSLAGGTKAKKTDPMYGLPDIDVGAGFMNFRDDSWIIRKREDQNGTVEPREEKGNSTWKISRQEWQTMLDTEPALQCKGTVYATYFGWEKEGTGVWVLDNVTEAIYNHLGSLPFAKDSTQINANLQAVGATFYDHWEQHPQSLEVMRGAGASAESKTIEGVTPEIAESSRKAEGITKRKEADVSPVEAKSSLVAIQYKA